MHTLWSAKIARTLLYAATPIEFNPRSTLTAFTLYVLAIDGTVSRFGIWWCDSSITCKLNEYVGSQTYVIG